MPERAVPQDRSCGAKPGGSAALNLAPSQPVIDAFASLGSPAAPAIINTDVAVSRTGIVISLDGVYSGLPSVDAYFGRYAEAHAAGACAGTMLGFRFRSDDLTSAPRGHAQVVEEHNGHFYP